MKDLVKERILATGGHGFFGATGTSAPNFDEGLHQTVAWYQEHVAEPGAISAAA